ncbi:contactin-associated protein-like 4 isoform X1 [Larimichthys crocea]|uniref:contactin-associated protein-like 4 isoform X1 n=1 Tax=Larimichthys crocea TaxID=215358 RepID=UPI000F5E2CBD|nr:contactin-associated protein-like 4 isoform X1 [Larimichthys crocea]XP_027147665.1 contactin-associated protein-like 4 isoform X1 [Larimichthys crocea]XP_027147666.1 contactin-associated protein-like 4 isoform X1 [Larimichthys crocea]XP_027147667.1 contactin-associated protein-like 4 isoform X1 [Larimichthys crocea]XP_027147668.1 contactin-associated protein-like 4 isoform X1 [Larimichthys crocea]
MKTCSCRQTRTCQLKKTLFLSSVRSDEERLTCSPPSRSRKCLSEETCLRLHRHHHCLTGSLEAFHPRLTVGFEEISLGAGEERLAVSLSLSPPAAVVLPLQPPRRFIMDLWTKRVVGIIVQVALLLSSSYGTTGEEVCDSALVSNLPPSSFRSSSQLSSSHAPGFAKLNRRDGAGGWSPLTSDRYQWLEVSLGERTKITAVATQGRYGSSDWLTSYLLMFSDTGHNWKQYRQEDSIGSFPGNSNADSVVQYKLQQPAIARFLRLIPLAWNPSGRIGLRLETYGCPYTSDVVSLDDSSSSSSSSSLVYRLSPGGPRRTSRDVISLKFKTLRNSGTLLHAEGEGGLGLSLELERGKLQLLLRQGRTSSSEPRRLASLGSLLDDQHWHHLAVERRGSHLNLTVDKHTERVQIPAEFSHWDIEQLSVGAVQRSQKLNFHGCLENLLYNDLNLIELAKNNDQQVTVVGNVTFSCAEPVSVAVTFPGPQSFLQLPLPTATASSSSGGLTVGFQFRTWDKAGLLLTFALPQEGGVVWLYLSEARLRLQIHKAGRALLELSAGSALNDGQWHSVELNSRRGRLTVSVDQEEGGVAHASSSVTAGSRLFFGGCPAEEDGHECENPFNIFKGCMRLLSIDSRLVDLIMVQQRLLGNYSHLQIDMCGIIDRCSPSRCEHGGRCSQSWTVFHCNCSDSGYSGATCHSSVYEQSCEAYKHNGNTSGHFYIDVDGSGPIKPQLVYCNMTEENTWMVIQHNNTELTRLRPSPGGNQHSVHFDYSTEEEQLLAAISQSEHCEQELSYQCRKSRLLNTPEGSPFSWWLGGPGAGRVQTYWGGSQPGSQQCACGLQGDCVDPQHYCNCDADRMEWTEDSGMLTHKESLPVKSLVLGDIQRPGSEAAYRVGPLSCHGDKNFWNAAFFDKETSYLHFPTFHGELSADISFLFKTTASSGVFLENLGIKDFIRIELSSSTQVVFSFDVGNGPLEVRVESSAPLNDNRWHRVQAERNIKEATLRLDELPAATQEAPADGHFHLQLNSQLFIGGTASRQKGFRGCIRSLQLNGVTLDLEERASITPGVRPGCPGHCSSYGSFCQNQGRCVERDAGFQCDCSLSAYTGVFCHTEVSAGFKSETSVSYTFKEPYELSRNSSALPSSIYSDMTLREENVSLSFRTNQSPAVLFYVSSYYREYLALLINKHDMLEVRYKLDGSRDVEVLRSAAKSLADGQLHTVSIRRLTDSVSVQIDQNAREDFNLTADGEFSAIKSLVLGRIYGSDDLDPDLARLASLGFTGCLSVVRFNSISPLKAALLHPDTSPVSITGPLIQSNCGSSSSANPYEAENTHHLSDQSGSVGSGQPLVNAIRTDSAVIGGVIAVVIFVIVTGLAITARFLYRRKETYRNQEVKGVKQDDSQDFPFNNQADSQNASGENPKEYFI